MTRYEFEFIYMSLFTRTNWMMAHERFLADNEFEAVNKLKNHIKSQGFKSVNYNSELLEMSTEEIFKSKYFYSRVDLLQQKSNDMIWNLRGIKNRAIDFFKWVEKNKPELDLESIWNEFQNDLLKSNGLYSKTRPVQVFKKDYQFI